MALLRPARSGCWMASQQHLLLNHLLLPLVAGPPTKFPTRILIFGPQNSHHHGQLGAKRARAACPTTPRLHLLSHSRPPLISGKPFADAEANLQITAMNKQLDLLLRHQDRASAKRARDAFRTLTTWQPSHNGRSCSLLQLQAVQQLLERLCAALGRDASDEERTAALAVLSQIMPSEGLQAAIAIVRKQRGPNGKLAALDYEDVEILRCTASVVAAACRCLVAAGRPDGLQWAVQWAGGLPDGDGQHALDLPA